MSARLEQIEAVALALPPKKRAQLVDKLWESLGDTTLPYLSDAWRAEIRRRCREVDEGKVRLIPGDQVMREARRKLKQLRPK
jgi:putative addiction module component (TIGR02574 family)